MAEKFEPPTRRTPKDDDDAERRTELLAVRMRPSSLEPIKAYARRMGWTKADAVRALLRAGLKAEGEIK